MGKQAEVPRLPEEEVQRSAQPWSLPLPCSWQDFLEVCPRNGPAQDRARQGCSEAPADLRGRAPSLRQEEEDGHPLRPQGAQAQARQEVLLSEDLDMRLAGSTRTSSPRWRPRGRSRERPTTRPSPRLPRPRTPSSRTPRWRPRLHPPRRSSSLTGSSSSSCSSSRVAGSTLYYVILVRTLYPEWFNYNC